MPEQQKHTNYRPKNASAQRRARKSSFSALHSPAKRRDNEQPATINSRDVRFPEGTGGLPLVEQGEADLAAGQLADPAGRTRERTLCDDMTLNLKSRSERRRKRVKHQRQAIGAIVVICLAAIFASGLLWMRYSNGRADALSKVLTSKQPASSVVATTTAGASTETTGLPTPVVASFKGIPLHLSVRMRDLTEVGFHPASNPYAMVLDTTLTPADATTVRATHTTGRNKSKQPTGDNVALIGNYIQMWRTDTGSIPGRTSIDEGAPAGSVTYAPITGTITAVREYNYENGCKDYEVHMSFEATALARYEVVMIHEENVKVKVGDEVTGGLTPIAQVRDLTPFLKNQLGEYTGEAGNHAHVQVNDLRAPSYAERQKYREQHNYYID
ncbi:MAG: hypothetical protein FWF45_01700 [Coriobacteriia bacterium]|nr:hypothetical protein [Coriobacteriia bacterium]